MRPPTTIPEQIEILKSRNLIFQDEAKAKEILLKYNYYRLSEYWRKYKINPNKEDNNFKDNITFEQIIAIYELGILLRSLLQQGLDICEVCFRTRFAYHTTHSKQDGEFSYLKPDSYNNKVMKNKTPDDFIAEIRCKIDCNKNESIKREIRKYWKNESIKREIKKTLELPIGIAVETLSFSTLSKMYDYWSDDETIQKISNSFKVFKNIELSGFGTTSKNHPCENKLQNINGFKESQNREILERTIHSLVALRNLCAHHSRIWNKIIIVPTPTRYYLKGQPKNLKKSPWVIISILMALVDEIVVNEDSTSLHVKIKNKTINKLSPLQIISNLIMTLTSKKDESYSTRVMKLCKSNKEFFKGLTSPTF
jgi:abortive infection bacteriophage resistance protein